MPLYDLLCPDCKKVSEYLLGICENDTEVQCTNKNCKTLLTRDKNTTYTSEGAPSVVTQTGVGNTNW